MKEKEIIEVLDNLVEKRITFEQARDKLFVLYNVMPRFFVDLRSGCGAVRDRLHPTLTLTTKDCIMTLAM